MDLQGSLSCLTLQPHRKISKLLIIFLQKALQKLSPVFFQEMGDATLSEFTLKTRRRVDLIALSRSQHITIVEVKSCLTDFSTDKKWQNYLDWADQFYFAVAENFPVERLADDMRYGILITDGFDTHILREAPLCKLPTQRRTHLIRRLAFSAMTRLSA